MNSPAYNLGRVRKWLLASCAVILLLFGGLMLFNTALAQNGLVEAKNSQKPVYLSIPRLNINLPVQESGYDRSTREWQISDTMAHYANLTPPLNSQSGNTLIFAHNKPGLFRETYNLVPGDKLVVQGDGGKRFVYAYQSEQITIPSDGSIFHYTGSAKLTLLSCYGENNELRRLMSFELVRIE